MMQATSHEGEGLKQQCVRDFKPKSHWKGADAWTESGHNDWRISAL